MATRRLHYNVNMIKYSTKLTRGVRNGNSTDYRLYGFFGMLIIWVGYWQFREFRTQKDCGGWNEGAKPNINAKVIDIQVERVIYTKNNAKFKTTVLFDDGYVFVSHKTDREDHTFRYKISISRETQEVIINNAITQHRIDVLKLGLK